MSPDNAAVTIVDETASAVPVPDFSAMTDRELLEYNARTLFEIVKVVNGIQGQVQPAMDKLAKNPLFGGLFR